MLNNEETLLELEKLQPVGVPVTFKGEALEIKPLKFGQFAKALRHLSNIFNLDRDYTEQYNSLLYVFENETAAGTISILKLIAEHTDDALALISIAINKPITEIEELEADEAANILKKLFEVNKDFFTQKILPLFPQLKRLEASQPTPTE